MNACAWPGCSGTVDETGFCDRCHLSPRAADSSQPNVVVAQPAGSPPTESSARWWGAGLISLPVTVLPDPASAVQSRPQVPQRRRACASCARTGHHVLLGIGYNGQPDLDEGFCPRCGTPFCFSPRLRPGEVVEDRYEVVGPLAHGGVGWVYLARDRKLDDNYVVLKGVINTSDEDAVSAMAAERHFLTSVDHPNIVRIFDFASHTDPDSGEITGYLVMEYLGGPTLHEITARRDEPLPLEHVIVYGLEILEALEYLHGRRLLYNDLKPGNVIRGAGRVKLIDLGAVCEFGHGRDAVWGTDWFQVTRTELAATGPTVGSDLHTVGRTLENLFTASVDWSSEYDAAGARTSPLATGIASFRRLVGRAAHPDPASRFRSAGELAGQLRGVLREVLALRTGQPRPEPSTVFAPTAALLDTGLGAVPVLERWTAPESGADLVDLGRPTAPAMVAGLPVPLVDPTDRAARFLATVSVTDPHRVITELAGFPGRSTEIALWQCRAHLELGELDKAADALATANTTGPPTWRLSWHRGLVALATNETESARNRFDEVYSAMPGELAPKLALACCAELLGSQEDADGYYLAVWRTDRAHVSAAFGLVRGRVRRGDRAGAVAVLDEVPAVSRHYDTAMIAALRVCTGRLETPGPPHRVHLPDETDLDEAVRRLARLTLDGGRARGESRDRLTTVVRQAAQDLLRRREVESIDYATDAPAAGEQILGRPLTARGIGQRLEESFRKLAGQARSRRDHTVLIGLANQARPRTWR